MAKTVAKRKQSSGGWGKFVFGFAAALLLAGAGAAAYSKFGSKPIVVAPKPVSVEKTGASPNQGVHAKQEIKAAPFGTSEDVFEAGAHVYRSQCASCHGTPGHDVVFAKYMDPAAPQLWKKHAKGDVVGVSDDEAGETYWKVANGIHPSGMPAYQHVLTDTQMWQVSLLLKNADQGLPDPVKNILTAK